MIRFFLLIIYFCFFVPLIAQKPLNTDFLNSENQYIIQISKKTDLNSIFSNLSSEARQSQIVLNIKQIMDEPLNLWVVSIPENSDATIRELKRNKEIIGISKNRQIMPRVTPNDPFFNNQWQYLNTETVGNDLDILRAWDITTGGLTPTGDTIVICVIDDGVNGNHEDLKGNIWINHLEIPNNGIDDDQNGYVDDYLGWNVRNNNDDVYSGGGHGTPVVGIVGAKGNNGIGVSGVNWNVKIMMVNYGSSTEANALSSYAYAYKMRKLYNESNGRKGAFIVATNASWGIDKTKAEEAPLWCALYDSLGNVGILNCGATANSNVDVDVEGDLPTSCTSEYLISVTNLNKSDVKVGAAGYGRKSIDLGAYGQGVYTLTRNDYGTFGGTSGATPHVAGVIGLLYSTPCMVFDSISKKNPGAAALIAKDMILNGVSLLSSLKGITTTGGKLNAYRSVSNLQSLCETCTPPSGITLAPIDESLIVSWVSGSETIIDLRYRKTDDLNWQVVSNFSKGDTLFNLKHCTEYEIQLSSQCGFLPNSYTYSKFVQTGGCCTKPEIDSLVGTDSTVKINWTSAIDAIYYLQYKEGQGIWIDTVIQDNQFELIDLADCTAYQFKIRSGCIKYGDFSDYTTPINISTSCGTCTELDYCTFGNKDVSDEWIESIMIGDQVFVSGPSEQGYKNFAGLTNFELQGGKTHPFIIKAGYSSTSFRDYYKILIDFNQDGIWSESEIVFQTPTGERDSVLGDIIVPLDAKDGYTKMRLIISYEQFDGGCDNDIFEYGEVEDYCVFISNEECTNDVVSSLISIQNDNLKFKFSYTNDRKDNVKLSFRPYGSASWESVIGRDTIVIEGLDKCTLYEYQYYGYCDTRLSNPSVTDTVRTSCLNNVSDLRNIFTITPNPTSDFITIYSNLKDLSISKLFVKDISGKEILTINLQSFENILDVSNLNSGIYIIEIHDKTGQKYVSKFTKI